MPSTRSRSAGREALFVRIPTSEAQRLDRAAFELRLSKQDIVSSLVSRYVDPTSPASMEALRALDGGGGTRPQPPAGGTLTLGHHDFRADVREVLTVADAAELLQVGEEVVERLASDGELPGRRIGEQWRFTRQAILDWLSAGSS
ncbi:helix-turn-helix domain-containing protein [Conexibacter sp. JD483]|uniref:helix-turn-helix domain-containing protein n=1 Tax=unclassified Conexibacter TaxID=2627773 RepID=UPI002720CBDC|nr:MULTISPECIES: helix-turn-helix domain-containing protein [unclassified Conexibacter]MDO8185174.1 helix-turn-helix domain-containing protein [Conexibacter sp. CPCC 205706]MDO8196884.1 helix-turn-helix domain-containing protein [Conexibacter sp. CPCC 205762]MDR9368660.1 helix-turn-helix domain-containing protein [Conexibacter sp. JD483]